MAGPDATSDDIPLIESLLLTTISQKADLASSASPSIRPVRIGTRGSALALAQAHLIAGLLVERNVPNEIVIVRTQGDADQTTSLAVLGGQGVFTSALQVALLRDEIDLAVHSAKDLPTDEHPDLDLVAFLSRQDPRDVLISRTGADLASLPPNSRVGTSSRRRIAQVMAFRPDLAIVDLRGNIDTRIRRATEGDLDAVVLAAAGLHRMGWRERITDYLPLDEFVPAPGQAALALEIRRTDPGRAARAAELDEPDVSTCVRAERAFLRAIGAGCTTPVGAHATIEGDDIRLRAMVASPNLLDVRWGIYDIAADVAEDGAARIAREMLGLVRTDRRSRRQPSLGGPTRPTVLVTRPGAVGLSLAAAVERAGGTAIVEPMLHIRPLRSAEAESAATRGRADGFDWVVLTSANAVDGILANSASPGGIPAVMGSARVAVVGAATANRLRMEGVEPGFVARRSDAAGLAAELIGMGIAGQSVWLPQGNLATDDLFRALTAAGAKVVTSEVYRVEPPAELAPAVRAALLQGDIDAALFASPSAARHLVELLGLDWSTLDAVRLIAIGPTTAAALARLDLDVAAIARRPSDDDLIDALRQALDGNGPADDHHDLTTSMTSQDRNHDYIRPID